MYELTVTTSFDAAHRLRNYSGKCARLHGHTWKVEVTVKGLELDDNGLLIDFSVLKKIINQSVELFDHNNLNEIEPFADDGVESLNPTAENIAKHIFTSVNRTLSNDYNQIKVKNVIVWESATSRAVYYEEDV